MGINDEYSRDAYLGDQYAYDSSGEEGEFLEEPMHPEDWQDWNSEQLLDAWMTLCQYAEERYISLGVSYPDFVYFVMNSTLYFQPVERPDPIAIQLWNAIKNIRVIRDFVDPDSFYTWVQNNINLDIN
jgi:hypothetical protein